MATSSTRRRAASRRPPRTQEDLPAVLSVQAVLRRRSRLALAIVALTLTLGTGIVLSVGFGAVSVPPGVTLRIVVDRLVPGVITESWRPVQEQIIWQYRLPRTLLAAVVGAGLALVGATLQAVVLNPLADPWVLGVSSGAGLGAVAVLVIGSIPLHGLSLSTAAFAGAIAATATLFAVARHQGRLTPLRLVLSGVALSYLFSAATSFLVLTTDAERVFSVLFFLLGSVAATTWNDLLVPLIAVVVSAAYLLTRARALNALLAGDETATALGVPVDRLRGELLLLTSLLTGVLVAVSGGIGFVGLVIPHIGRLVVGADHRRLLPVAALVGATFLVVVDLAARTVANPVELPIGIVTATIGAPFFLWLMRRESAARRGGLAR